MIHQRHVHHRTFVHDQQIAFERPGLVSRETARARPDFEQAVNRFGLESGRFSKALGRAAGRCAQQAAHFLSCQDFQDGLHQGRLADSRPARDDQNPRGQSSLKRLALAGSQLHSGFGLAPLHSLVEINRRIARARGAQILHPFRDPFLGSFQNGQEDEFLSIDPLRYQVAVRLRLRQGNIDDFFVHEQKLSRLLF